MAESGMAAFLVMWSAMMAAMMVPSMLPTASRWLRTFEGTRPVLLGRGSLFVGGYLLVWSSTGLVGYGLVRLADALVRGADVAPGVVAAILLGTSALYSLTDVKHRLLRQCRSPFGLILQWSTYRRGRLRDLRAGTHHGVTCLGCCWALMALMVVFGTMNVAAMAALTAVVAVEKLWRDGERFARAVGWVTAVLAVAVYAVPGLATGLTMGGST